MPHILAYFTLCVTHFNYTKVCVTRILSNPPLGNDSVDDQNQALHETLCQLIDEVVSDTSHVYAQY